MIEIHSAKTLDLKLLFDILMEGFSDYAVKLNITYERFYGYFFESEGNDLALSHVAFEDGEPAGIILAGKRQYEGSDALRCGCLAVAPRFRRRGAASKLMERHIFDAKSQLCDTMFLEVLNGNDTAFDFYKKLGYCETARLSYYTLDDFSRLNERKSAVLSIVDMQKDDAISFKDAHQDAHTPWQNDFGAMWNDKTYAYACEIDGEVIGIIAGERGIIQYLYVMPQWRRLSVASNLLLHAVSKRSLESLFMVFPAGIATVMLAKGLGFNNIGISQTEMVRDVDE